MPASKYSTGLEGRRYFHTVVISFSHLIRTAHEIRYYWNCLCDCGIGHVADARSLARGYIMSCGCWNRDPAARAIKHGHARDNQMGNEYKSWRKMRYRCNNPDNEWFHRYQGRGITYCAGLDDFSDFLRVLGTRPEGHSLDRMDNDGSYSCGTCAECVGKGWGLNVHWATPTEQSNNQERTLRLTVGERTQPISLWAKELEIKRSQIYTAFKQSEAKALALVLKVLESRN